MSAFSNDLARAASECAHKDTRSSKNSPSLEGR
jgi:hypothetical protein